MQQSSTTPRHVSALTWKNKPFQTVLYIQRGDDKYQLAGGRAFDRFPTHRPTIAAAAAMGHQSQGWWYAREREREREYNSFNIPILIPKTVSFPSFLPFSEAHRRRSNYRKLLIIHAPLISFLLKIHASPLRTSLLLLYYENKNEANIDRSFIHVQSSLEMDNNRIL